MNRPVITNNQYTENCEGLYQVQKRGGHEMASPIQNVVGTVFVPVKDLETEACKSAARMRSCP
jgi:hypothetical protein